MNKKLKCDEGMNQLVSFFLRVGISSALLYAAFATFLNPIAWVGFLPSWIPDGQLKLSLLMLWSVYEVLLSLWLLWGKKLVYSSSLAALSFLGIIVLNLTLLDIVFRDIPILFAAIALVIFGYQKKGWE